jgi:hypothetical protein
MLAEWLAIVNLKNKLLSRNRTYEENRYRLFDVTLMSGTRANASSAGTIFITLPQSRAQRCSSGIPPHRLCPPDGILFVT